jgi:ElaB/YqjD/DUF883 family membrane-anchored ribosome-binding protein
MERTKPLHEGPAGVADGAARAIHEAVDNIGSKTKPVVERATASAHETVDRVAGVANATAERVQEKAQALKETQDRFYAECREYVQHNPLTALCVAAAAGFIVSRLTR